MLFAVGSVDMGATEKVGLEEGFQEEVMLHVSLDNKEE